VVLLERMRALRSAGSAPTAIGRDRFEIRLADREQIQVSKYRDIPVATTSLDYLFDERVGAQLDPIVRLINEQS